MFFNVQPMSSGGKVASAVLKANPGRVHYLGAYNANGATRFVQLFNTVAVPADTAVPLFTREIAATSSIPQILEFPGGLLFSTGICICISTTVDTKTVGAADLIYLVGVS